MNFIWNFPLFTIILSLFSGGLCMILSKKKARICTVVIEILLIVLVLNTLFFVTREGGSFTYVMGEFPAPWGNEIRAGTLEALLALIFLLVMLSSVLAGIRFVDMDIDESKINLYYSLVHLMTAAIMAILWTNDIFTGYVFLEILTLAGCGVLIVREIGRTTLAAVRYMLLNLLGSGLFLLGVVFLYDITGHLLMVPMRESILELAEDPQALKVLTMVTGIITIGLCVKSGLFPFHFWMPDTYGRATPSSASMLSAVVSKTYIFLLIKIYWRVIGLDVMAQMPVGNILFVLGSCGMVFGSVAAIRADNINRMVAFSSAAQIGYIYLGIGIGGAEGYTAAIFHIITHAVTKSLLFLTTPWLAQVSGGRMKCKSLQGSARKDVEAGIFFVTGALSMVGIPLFAGFSSKLLFGLSAVEHGSDIKLILTFLSIAVSTMLNALYFIRTVIRIYSRPETEDSGADEGGSRHPLHYRLPMLLLVTVNVFLGLFSWIAVDLIHKGLDMFV